MLARRLYYVQAMYTKVLLMATAYVVHSRIGQEETYGFLDLEQGELSGLVNIDDRTVDDRN